MPTRSSPPRASPPTMRACWRSPRRFPSSAVIVLAMGELGFPTRVLSPAFGGLYHLRRAQLRRGHRLRPGQRAPAAPSLSRRKAWQSRQDLRRDRRSGPPFHFARRAQSRVPGAPHGRRLSAVPGRAGLLCAIFSRWPTSCRSPASASPFRTSRRSFAIWISWIRWHGASAPSTRCGARPANGAAPIPMPPASPVPSARLLGFPKPTVLIVGNGGAARGAAFALADAGAKISIIGRNPDRVRALPSLRRRSPARASSRRPAFRRRGSRHAARHVSARRRVLLRRQNPADMVFDMVYNPLETKLVQRAKEQGKPWFPGFEMFLEQAARQFEIWTGETAPRAVMEKAALEALTGGGQVHRPSSAGPPALADDREVTMKLTRRKLATVLASVAAAAAQPPQSAPAEDLAKTARRPHAGQQPPPSRTPRSPWPPSPPSSSRPEEHPWPPFTDDIFFATITELSAQLKGQGILRRWS